MPRVMARLVADAVLVGVLLFISAGTLAWWRAWVLLAVLLLVRAAGALAVYRVHPGLLPRVRPTNPDAKAASAAGIERGALSLRANAFAVAVVRVQGERAHGVADSGVYGVIRHPFYAADPLILVGLGLWLGRTSRRWARWSQWPSW